MSRKKKTELTKREIKENKGWGNTVRLITGSPEILSSFLGNFKWEKYLTLITEVFEVNYIARDLFSKMELLGHSKLVETRFYPFSFIEEANNSIDIFKTEDFGEEPSFYKKYGNFSDIYFKGESIKNSSRSKIS